MVTTRSTAKNGGTAAATLDANTPALRAAQRELKAKAILSVRLAKIEPIMAELVQHKKLVVEHLASAIKELDEGESGNFRRECVRRGLELVHHQTIHLSVPGTCALAWGNTAVALGIYEHMVKNKEKMEKEWEKMSVWKY
ncbi:hypothetical protein SLS58_003274 [Diplodia intermedia]|uniref:Uncharacterized protein n=1 Tax=Diplodia intermedia TaxID=856260 RepID=A0ABR3TWJ2_9PEZI